MPSPFLGLRCCFGIWAPFANAFWMTDHPACDLFHGCFPYNLLWLALSICIVVLPVPILSFFFGQSKVVDSFGTADAKAAEIKTNTSSGEVTILKLAPLSDTSGNSTSTDFQAVEVGSGCPSHMMAHVGLTNDSRLKETFSNQIRCAGLYSAGRNVCAASKFAAGQCRSLADQGRRK